MKDDLFNLLWDKKRLTKSLKFYPYSLLANLYTGLFIEYSSLKDKSQQHKDFLSFFSIYGLVAIESQSIKSLLDLKKAIEIKRLTVLPFADQLYSKIDLIPTERLAVLCKEKELVIETDKLKVWKLNFIDQLIDLEYEGLDSLNFVYIFLNSDSIILETFKSDQEVLEYYYISLLTSAYSKEPILTNQIVDNYFSKFNYFPINVDPNLTGEWESQLKKIVNGTARKSNNKLFDTTGLISQLINIIEDSNNSDLSNFIMQLSSLMQSGDSKKVIETLSILAKQILLKYNEYIKNNHLLFNSKVSIIEKLGAKKDEFLDLDTLTSILDSLGYYVFINENGEFYIKANHNLTTQYLEGYHI